jgi:hypothetical protein
MSADRPSFPATVRLARALGRGSPVDPRRSTVAALRELRSDTPADSPLTLQELMARADYRELMTAKVAVGDPAFDFELPRYDFTNGDGLPTGSSVRLADFQWVRPVALVFGSYT